MPEERKAPTGAEIAATTDNGGHDEHDRGKEDLHHDQLAVAGADEVGRSRNVEVGRTDRARHGEHRSHCGGGREAAGGSSHRRPMLGAPRPPEREVEDAAGPDGGGEEVGAGDEGVQ